MNNNDKDKMYACWLDSIYWLGAKAKHKLYKIAGSAENIYNMDSKELSELAGEKISEKIKHQKEQFPPERIWNFISGKNIKYTYINANDYPLKLKNISDLPFGLFYKGELPKEEIPSVAIIGARKCSEYGKIMAEQFTNEFAAKGINIISGMALGIDGISQKTAIKAGGKTYAILGCGVDIVYPKTNQGLYNQLLEKGGIISEYPPLMEPHAMLFPPRNRIISALSDVVLVVEAREKSGTLITVDMALEQGREVYAIPGKCTDELSSGCNKLIRQGANIVTSAEDIIIDMGWDRFDKNNIEIKKQNLDSLSPIALKLYGAMEMLPLSQDEIIVRLRENGCDVSISEICQGFFELELKKLIGRSGGKYNKI